VPKLSMETFRASARDTNLSATACVTRCQSDR
jgi:hypothetical protein